VTSDGICNATRQKSSTASLRRPGRDERPKLGEVVVRQGSPAVVHDVRRFVEGKLRDSEATDRRVS
jgi:hypothetical protein